VKLNELLADRIRTQVDIEAIKEKKAVDLGA
jgi:hypothetical protein